MLEELPVNGSVHDDNGPSSYPIPDHDSAPGSSEALTWKLRMQERRIESMEKKLAGLNRTSKSTLDLPSQFDDIEPDEPRLREEVMFRGKGFKTQFHGSTSALSSLATVYTHICIGNLPPLTRS
jgi:hypothetical protein